MEKCAFCGAQGGMESIRRCSACKSVGYCSHQCQKGHWSLHKADCRLALDKSLHDKDSSLKSGDTGARPKAGETTSPSGEESSIDGPLTTCRKCGIQRLGMNWCGSCRSVAYCSRDCQRADWKTHKATCQALDQVAMGDGTQTQEREPAKARKGKREDKSRQQESLSASLSRAHLTPPWGWEEARARAERQYPRLRIVDTFRELGSDWMGVVRKEVVVAVVKIGVVYPHFFREGRCLEDAEGKTSFVLFHTPKNPRPYFRYEQLREGNFLCYEHAHMHFFMDGTVGFRIDEARQVHILEMPSHPSPSAPGHPPVPPAHPATAQQWGEARTKAQAMFPGRRLVDCLEDIDHEDLTSFLNILPLIPPTWDEDEKFRQWEKGEVKGALLLLLESPFSHSWHHGWAVRDRKGKPAQLHFERKGSPAPHFQFEDLQKGHFLCVSQPCVKVEMDCFTVSVTDASSVRIIKP